MRRQRERGRAARPAGIELHLALAAADAAPSSPGRPAGRPKSWLSMSAAQLRARGRAASQPVAAARRSAASANAVRSCSHAHAGRDLAACAAARCPARIAEAQVVDIERQRRDRRRDRTDRSAAPRGRGAPARIRRRSRRASAGARACRRSPRPRPRAPAAHRPAPAPSSVHRERRCAAGATCRRVSGNAEPSSSRRSAVTSMRRSGSLPPPPLPLLASAIQSIASSVGVRPRGDQARRRRRFVDRVAAQHHAHAGLPCVAARAQRQQVAEGDVDVALAHRQRGPHGGRPAPANAGLSSGAGSVKRGADQVRTQVQLARRAGCRRRRGIATPPSSASVPRTYGFSQARSGARSSSVGGDQVADSSASNACCGSRTPPPARSDSYARLAVRGATLQLLGGEAAVVDNRPCRCTVVEGQVPALVGKLAPGSSTVPPTCLRAAPCACNGSSMSKVARAGPLALQAGQGVAVVLLQRSSAAAAPATARRRRRRCALIDSSASREIGDARLERRRRARRPARPGPSMEKPLPMKAMSASHVVHRRPVRLELELAVARCAPRLRSGRCCGGTASRRGRRRRPRGRRAPCRRPARH